MTGLLHAWSQGDAEAQDKLWRLVFPELRRLAHICIRQESSNHTLDAHAIINELYIRLTDWKQARWSNRAHFFGMSSRMMRQILIDHARSRASQKRGSNPDRITLDEAIGLTDRKCQQLIYLDEALRRLADIHPRKSDVVELRFFGQIIGRELKTGQERVLVRGGATSRYLRSGYLIYSRAGKIMAIKFDPAHLQTSGVAIPVLDDVREGTLTADYDVSASGSIAYIHQSAGARSRIPVLVDLHGHPHVLPGLVPAYYQNPRYSPDGRQVAFNVTGSLIDIWLYDLTRTTFTRLPAATSSQTPVWSPDGARIAYRRTRNGFRNLFARAADGTGGEEQLSNEDKVQTPWSWAPDGTLAITESENIVLLSSNSQRQPNNMSWKGAKPRFSQDGRWLAYVSSESGRAEVYVQPYPGLKGKWQVSTDGGQEAVWAHSGRALFYRNADKMMVVDVRPGPTFSAPRLLFAGDYFRGEPTVDFDVAPDDQNFLMIQPTEKEFVAKGINIILNWAAELKDKLPHLEN